MTFIFKVTTLGDFEVFIIISIIFVVLNFSPLKMPSEKEAEEDFKIINKD